MQFQLFKKIRQKLDQIVTGKGKVDEDLFEELEVLMIQADISVQTTTTILQDLRLAVKEESMLGIPQVLDTLKKDIRRILEVGGSDSNLLKFSDTPPTLYLIVGVNGVGKTTTIAKITNLMQKRGKRVVLAAGDTFRAAAIDQIEIWANRTKTEIVKHREGADPSAVVFDAIRAARSRGADLVIADTAGRLHTRANLMEELRKINRVAERELGRPADETLLVLDATTGQNAISQARQFLNSVPLTGLVLAKLDSTARGGIVISIADELKLPIKLVGTGEKLEDIQIFDPKQFTDALLAD